MPCDSSHMEATGAETELSRVLACLDELDGKGAPTAEQWRGYGSGYGTVTKQMIDDKTAELCERLKRESDVTCYSLELQAWWRDHQKHDAERDAKDGA